MSEKTEYSYDKFTENVKKLREGLIEGGDSEVAEFMDACTEDITPEMDENEVHETLGKAICKALVGKVLDHED